MQQATCFDALKNTLEQYRSITLNTLLGALPSKESRKYLYDLLPVYSECAPAKGYSPHYVLRPARLLAVPWRMPSIPLPQSSYFTMLF